MSSIASRANSLMTVGMYAMSAVAISAFLSTHFLGMSFPANVKLNKVIIKNIQEFETRSSRNDVATMTFDLQFNSDPLWNWNTKQLYLYLIAEYSTDRNELNQVIIWDKIIEKENVKKLKSKGKLTYKAVRNKYYFFDDGPGLVNNNNVTLYLAYNVIPNIGYFWLINSEGRYKYEMPDRYQENKYY